jgi:hypothetical protein
MTARRDIGSGSRGRSAMMRTAGFGTLVLLKLLPVWTVGYLPSQDGPNHLLIAISSAATTSRTPTCCEPISCSILRSSPTSASTRRSLCSAI